MDVLTETVLRTLTTACQAEKGVGLRVDLLNILHQNNKLGTNFQQMNFLAPESTLDREPRSKTELSI
jgi:hypothetical protein